MEAMKSMLSNLKSVYTEMNPSTLSGAMDIIVIEQANGSLHCSPFHVRFGKLSVLYPKDQKVEIAINEQKEPFSMRLGEDGKAFFKTTDNTLVSSVLELVIRRLYSTEPTFCHKRPIRYGVFLFGNGCTNPFVLTRTKYHPVKTLELTSNQLKQLGLVKGVNTIRYSVESTLQGTATCTAKVFFWDHNVNLVVSDIDGTITKSDKLGHLLALVGRDWTHEGIAKLYTNISNNGYHFIYLTSRAIGQADNTRDYLKSILQHKYQLPHGPVIMSPDRLFKSFHREVIIKKPDMFKSACLRNIQQLFGKSKPFHSGFGNRITDVIAYRNATIPSSRIFIIDSQGELKSELLKEFKSTYDDLNSIVHHMFPSVSIANNIATLNHQQSKDNKEYACDYWSFSMFKTTLQDTDIPHFLSFSSKLIKNMNHSDGSDNEEEKEEVEIEIEEHIPIESTLGYPLFQRNSMIRNLTFRSIRIRNGQNGLVSQHGSKTTTATTYL